MKANAIACPFCGEGDFDEIGLKFHFTAGHCEPFDATENIGRISLASGEPTDAERLDWLEQFGQRLRRSHRGAAWRAIALGNALSDDGEASPRCETARAAIDAAMRREREKGAER